MTPPEPQTPPGNGTPPGTPPATEQAPPGLETKCELTGFQIGSLDTPAGPIKVIAIDLAITIPLSPSAAEQAGTALLSSKLVVPTPDQARQIL